MKQVTTIFLVLVGMNAFAKGPLFAGFAPVPNVKIERPKVEKKAEPVGKVELPEVEIPSDNEIAATCHEYYVGCRAKGRSDKACSAVADFCSPSSLRM